MANRPLSATVAARRARNIELRVQGYSFEYIMHELGYLTLGAATKDFCRAAERNAADVRHNLEVFRHLESVRMDEMLLALHPGIMRGNPRSIEVALKISERRAKMMGLDAVEKIQVITIDVIDEQISKLTAEVEEAIRRRELEAAKIDKANRRAEPDDSQIIDAELIEIES